MSPWFSWLPHDTQAGLSAWLSTQPDPDLAWTHCPDPSWLLFALAASGADGRALVRCAADCAETALYCVPDSMQAPRRTIRAARRWAAQRATLEIVGRLAAAADRDLRSSPSTAAFEAISAAIAVADLARTGSPFDAASAGHGAVQAVAWSASIYACTQRPVRDAHEARLCRTIQVSRWPLPSIATPSLCRPSLQVAHDLAQEASRAETLSTIAQLSHPSLLCALGARVQGASASEYEMLRAIASHIAAADDPRTLFDKLVPLLS